MKQRAFVLLLASGLAAGGCAKPHVVTEAELLGTWRNVVRRPAGPPRFFIDEVLVRRQGTELLFYSEQGLEFVDLTPSGDSLSMRQGCFRYKHAVSFQKARPGSRDTLFVAGFGKYTRLDTATFFAAWRVRTAALTEQQRLFDLRHGRAEEEGSVAGQGQQ